MPTCLIPFTKYDADQFACPFRIFVRPQIKMFFILLLATIEVALPLTVHIMINQTLEMSKT